MLVVSVAATVLLCALAIPRSARAQEEVTFAPPWEGLLRYAGEFGGFRIAAGVGYRGFVDVSRQELPSPDIVIVSPGGILTPPAPCIQPDANTIRCPILNLNGLQIDFGAGNDRLDTTRYDSPTLAGFSAQFHMGAGNDRFLGGPLPENWFGGPGNDFAKTGAGDDRLIAGAGNDRMFGDLGIDFFLGGKGKDLGRGGAGNDRGNGGPGEDDFRD
jgi:RTX calcium-binding nonapeptide repeat (4 copies)